MNIEITATFLQLSLRMRPHKPPFGSPVASATAGTQFLQCGVAPFRFKMVTVLSERET